jgi:hypothetical protein
MMSPTMPQELEVWKGFKPSRNNSNMVNVVGMPTFSLSVPFPGRWAPLLLSTIVKRINASRADEEDFIMSLLHQQLLLYYLVESREQEARMKGASDCFFFLTWLHLTAATKTLRVGLANRIRDVGREGPVWRRRNQHAFQLDHTAPVTRSYSTTCTSSTYIVQCTRTVMAPEECIFSNHHNAVIRYDSLIHSFHPFIQCVILNFQPASQASSSVFSVLVVQVLEYYSTSTT